MYTMDTTVPDHVVAVADNIRPADLEECLAEGFEDPAVALFWSVEMSDGTCTVLLDDKPVGIWGFSDEHDGSCLVWTVGTEGLVREPLALHKASIAFRDELLEKFDTLRNTVFRNNKVHIAWLRSLGAVFTETPDPDFLEFEITKQ